MTNNQKSEIKEIQKEFENFDIKDQSCLITNVVIANLGVAIRMILPDGKVATFYRDGCEPTLRFKNKQIVNLTKDYKSTEKVFDHIFFK